MQILHGFATFTIMAYFCEIGVPEIIVPMLTMEVNVTIPMDYDRLGLDFVLLLKPHSIPLVVDNYFWRRYQQSTFVL
jgi:hypothetical protein